MNDSIPRTSMLTAVLAVASLFAGWAAAAELPSEIPSEIPASFDLQTPSFDYTKQTVMVPMRDGVKLHTVIWVPKNVLAPMPLVVTRTPLRCREPPRMVQQTCEPDGGGGDTVAGCAADRERLHPRVSGRTG